MQRGERRDQREFTLLKNDQQARELRVVSVERIWNELMCEESEYLWEERNCNKSGFKVAGVKESDNRCTQDQENHTCCSSSAAELGCSDRILMDCGNQTWEEEQCTAGQLKIQRQHLLNFFSIMYTFIILANAFAQELTYFNALFTPTLGSSFTLQKRQRQGLNIHAFSFKKTLQWLINNGIFHP